MAVGSFLVTGLARGADVTLAWDSNREPDLAGYRLHYGFGPRAHTVSIDVGNVTRRTVALPVDGETYSIAVSGLSGAVQSATLRLRENGDPGHGTYSVRLDSDCRFFRLREIGQR